MRAELRPLRQRLRLPFWHRADIEAEIASHLDDAEADLHSQGLGEAEAQGDALEHLGDLDSLGDSLQSIHQGWTGGVTVHLRLAKLMLGVVALCAAIGLWLYFVMSEIQPGFVASEMATRDDTLWIYAHRQPDPIEFWLTLLRYRDNHPLVVWMGIIDPSAKLVFSDPSLGRQAQPLPEADWFRIRFGASGKRAASPSASSDLLKKKLKSAGIPAAGFHSVDLGRRTERGLTPQTYTGTAIIAYGEPLWGERIVAAVTNVWFWYGLVWLLASAAILLYHRHSDSFGAWVWAIIALPLGPVIWLTYLLLARLGQVPHAQVAGLQRRLLWLPIAGLAFTATLAARPVLTVPAAWIDLYAFHPQRAAETLRQSRAGVRILLAAAESRQYLTRRAAVHALLTYISNSQPRVDLLSWWMRLLQSKYSDARMLGCEGLGTVSAHRGELVDANKLFQAWKIALSSKDAEVRSAAWIDFSLSLLRADGVPHRFAARIHELLALGKRDAALDDLFARWLQYGRTVYDVGPVVIGTERRLTVDIKPSRLYAHPEYAARAARATTTSRYLQASVHPLGATALAPVRLELTYSAHGPAGAHFERINLLSTTSTSFALAGIVDLRANETANRASQKR